MCIDLIWYNRTTLLSTMAAELRFSGQQGSFLKYMFIKLSHVKVSQRVIMIEQLFSSEFSGVKLPCKATMFNIRKKCLSHGSHQEWINNLCFLLQNWLFLILGFSFKGDLRISAVQRQWRSWQNLILFKLGKRRYIQHY